MFIECLELLFLIIITIILHVIWFSILFCLIFSYLCCPWSCEVLLDKGHDVLLESNRALEQKAKKKKIIASMLMG